VAVVQLIPAEEVPARRACLVGQQSKDAACPRGRLPLGVFPCHAQLRA